MADGAPKSVVPEPLTPDMLAERLRILAANMKPNSCGALAEGIAVKIVNWTEGGNQWNLLNAIPSLHSEEPGSLNHFIPEADIIKAAPGESPRVDSNEQAIMLLAAVRLAKKANAADVSNYLANLKPDASFFKEVDAVCKEFNATSCKGAPYQLPKSR